MTIRRILGKRGRITVPYAIRCRMGLRCNDVLSFTMQDDRTVVIRQERICDECADSARPTLTDFLDSLSAEEQREALVHLSVLWAKQGKE